MKLGARATSRAWFALSLAACGGPTPPPKALVSPVDAAPAASASTSADGQSAGAPKEAAAWQPPGEVTKDTVRRECGAMLEALRSAVQQQQGAVVTEADVPAIRERLQALPNEPPFPRERFEWCKTQLALDLDRMSTRSDAKTTQIVGTPTIETKSVTKTPLSNPKSK